MGELLGIGCTHGRIRSMPGGWMADIYFRRNLASELTPPEQWRDLTDEQIRDAGQHEILN